MLRVQKYAYYLLSVKTIFTSGIYRLINWIFFLISENVGRSSGFSIQHSEAISYSSG